MKAAALVTITALAAVALARIPANHDVAWYVYMVQAWLGGARPYVDLIDTNPPLILFLTAPPVWLASVLGIKSLPAFWVWAFGCALVSWRATVWAVGRAAPEISTERRGVISLAVLFLMVAFPKTDFAQREHFALMLTLPYVMLAAARASGVSVRPVEAVVAGIAGGCGFALKPFFPIAFVAIELAVAIRRRSLRSLVDTAPLAALCTMAAYAALVVVAFPEYFDVINRVRQVYSGDSQPLRLLSLRELQVWAAMAAIVVLIRFSEREYSMQFVIAAAATGLLVAGLVQGKGWTYHMLPGQVGICLYFVLFVTGLFTAVPPLAAIIRGGTRAVALALTALFVVMSAKYAYEGGRGRRPDLVTPMARIVEARAPGGVVTVLGMRTLLYPAFPLVNQTGARWGMRHNGLWFLAGFYAFGRPGETTPISVHRPDEMSALERGFFEDVVSDIARTPPDLLMIESAAHFSPAGRQAVDLAAYYWQDARFAHVFSNYERIDTVGPFEIYARRR